MSLSWSNEETFKFIELYQSEPAIWDSKSELHKDKNQVNDAWSRIANSINVPVANLKRKKETLMAAFRMHFKKKQDSIRSGAVKEEVYNPVWIFYDTLESFLKEKYECKSVISTDEQSKSLLLGEDAVIGEPAEQDTETSSDARSNTEMKEKKIPVQRRRSAKPPELEKAEKDISNAFKTLNEVLINIRQENKTDDDCELYGRLLANKLRKYSEQERQEIMYEIDGLLLRRRRNCGTTQYLSSP